MRQETTAGMSEERICLDKVSVGYDGCALIKDIDISVGRGEILALIGPNGAGKSTILRTIIRQLEMLGGKIRIAGRDLRTYSFGELSSTMSVVLTDRISPELMTCREIVAAGRYPYTGRFGILTQEDEEKVDEALRIVGAEKYADQDFNQISDGQRQRILLGRAICQEPDVMILDEPTSFLDIRHKLDILSVLRKLARDRGMTVIMSLHEIDLAMKIADRIMCVKGDRIYASGTPEDIFRGDMIKKLYDIDRGSFDTLTGSVEFPARRGIPEVFVISDSGRGIPVYRMLQRQCIPFAAGILYTNDVDYRVAKQIATETVSEKPFVPIGEDAWNRAAELIVRCGRVINAGITDGETNIHVKDLLSFAGKKNIPVEDLTAQSVSV